MCLGVESRDILLYPHLRWKCRGYEKNDTNRLNILLMKTIVLTQKIAVLFSFLLASFSQNLIAGECYIKVESEDILPISEDGDGGWTKNETFNELLEKYEIKKYYQAFPTAPTDWLLGMYVLEGDMSIMDELKTSYSKEISLWKR